MTPAWYFRRLQQMGPQEIAARVADAVLQRSLAHWATVRKAIATPRLAAGPCSFGDGPFEPSLAEFPQPAVSRLLLAADEVLEGRWCVFGVPHPSFGERPDWFIDSKSGRRAPSDRYAFDIPYRDENSVGNIKYIWEPSRHHHLTLLAAAFAASGDDRYAERIDVHLRSWWDENPFLTGPHWTSGIEIGIRLIAWVWIRRLLSGWSPATSLFEGNPAFVSQLYWHQKWLSMFPSRGSSANNHSVAEAAGLFSASCAFPLFLESPKWRRWSASKLRQEAVRQTYPDGLHRELATDYHGLVLELFVAAAIEGERAANPVGPIVWERIRAMTDVVAAFLDECGHPPRQGDSDEGMALLLDAQNHNRWVSLLTTGARLFGKLSWWPKWSEEDVRSHIWTFGVKSPPLPAERPSRRPNAFAEAGHVYLRANRGGEEIWCRCDHGPLGYLSIAAHGHADALSVELRLGCVEILAEPGTYCYHGDPVWRSYFRSTIGHNTLELMSRDQSRQAGPFLWTQHATSRCISIEGLDEEVPTARWEAEQLGYTRSGGPIHRRSVTMDRSNFEITIADEIVGGTGPVPARLCFHLGPEVECHLHSRDAVLRWPGGKAEMVLPASLEWKLHRGETNPPLGWYSRSFGEKQPSFTLAGAGLVENNSKLLTHLKLAALSDLEPRPHTG